MTLKAIMVSVILFSCWTYANSDTNISIPFHLAKGKTLYSENCTVCHGKQLQGTDKGPPLIHSFYKPSHHGDGSFYRAALSGVRAHHWNFGDMPPVQGMTEKKMDSIIPFIRYYQKQKGL